MPVFVHYIIGLFKNFNFEQLPIKTGLGENHGVLEQVRYGLVPKG
jgi:hypothetical protein